MSFKSSSSSAFSMPFDGWLFVEEEMELTGSSISRDWPHFYREAPESLSPTLSPRHRREFLPLAIIISINI